MGEELDEFAKDHREGLTCICCFGMDCNFSPVLKFKQLGLVLSVIQLFVVILSKLASISFPAIPKLMSLEQGSAFFLA